MHRSTLTALAVSIVTASSLSVSSFGAGPAGTTALPVKPTVNTPLKKIELNLDKSVAIPVPMPRTVLKATIFKTPDNREGWAIKIPGQRPIATPTYYDGKIYAGGGYGSHEFYCFNALTGALIWKYHTSDDGPTAAVVENGMVAFNTESCTVYVLDAQTGKLVWQEWLGDPLMSQPAVASGKLYIAYPGNARQKGLNMKGDSRRPHRLLCADLKTGKHIWEHGITADVISAPVIDNGKVVFTCHDGTSFCLSCDTGEKVWEKANAATSAPVIVNGNVLVTEKEQRNNQTFEGIQIVDSKTGKSFYKDRVHAKRALYFQSATNGTIGPQAVASLDASVGFGGGAPAAAQMNKAKSHLNLSTVAAAWAYQGPRLSVKGSHAFKAQGTSIQSFNLKNSNKELASLQGPGGPATGANGSTAGKAAAKATAADEPTTRWEAEVKGKSISADSQVFSPPSLGKNNMYLVSQAGHLVSLNQKTGQVAFSYATNQPVAMQPALANGNVYIGTSNGMLICIKTGDPDADGWTAWGGNSQHNKLD